MSKYREIKGMLDSENHKEGYKDNDKDKKKDTSTKKLVGNMRKQKPKKK